MAISQRLDLRQAQTLTMTPQLQQAIKLLQMSNLELSEFVEAELEKNPLLERDDKEIGERKDSETESQSAEDFQGEKDVAERAAEHETKVREDTVETDAIDRISEGQELDTDFDNVFTGESQSERENDILADSQAAGYESSSLMTSANKGGDLKFDNPDYSLENTVSDKLSLRVHILEQVQVTFATEKERLIAVLLVDYLDESGYMRKALETFATQLSCSVDEIETVLKQMQSFDPTGVFARDLGECLALQLQELNRFDPAMEKMLTNLHFLAEHKFSELKALCGVDDEDFMDMVSEIKRLNPKPAADFDHFVSQTVVPDVVMRPLPKRTGGGWTVELNSETLPRVLVNTHYYAEVKKGVREKEEKEFVNEQYNTANWLVKAMDQRAQTILKVSKEIIRKQDAFFVYGVEYLKPLVLRDIAEVIEMHESTISRVTNNKYIETPRGIFELKYFFSSAIAGADGAVAHSSESVKARIKILVDAEDPKKILSDDALVEHLKKEGVEIARRTVAKYRDALKIPSSVQRRRQKKTL